MIFLLLVWSILDAWTALSGHESCFTHTFTHKHTRTHVRFKSAMSSYISRRAGVGFNLSSNVKILHLHGWFSLSSNVKYCTFMTLMFTVQMLPLFFSSQKLSKFHPCDVGAHMTQDVSLTLNILQGWHTFCQSFNPS